MTKKEFLQETNECVSVAVERSNKFLEPLNLSLVIDWEYDEWGGNNLQDAIGVYERDSVFGGEITIGFHMKNLYKVVVSSIKQYPWSDPYTMLDETIQTNVFHEMGHGIVQMFNDYLQECDDLDELYDNNKQLFDYVLDNEEDAVEEFAWDFYDNQVENSSLGKIVKLYVNMYDGNDLNESQGVVENGLEKFAEYLYNRCINTKQHPNRWGEINFTIPSAQWNKYNTYKLSCDKIQIRLCNSNSFYAAVSYRKRIPLISITYDLIYSKKDKFIASLMHELTHLVNGTSGLKNGEHPITRNEKQKMLQRNHITQGTIQDYIEYYFTPTEINARLTQAYYYLKGNIDEILWRYEDNPNDIQGLTNFIFREINHITFYKKMCDYTQKVFVDINKEDARFIDYDAYKHYQNDLSAENNYENSDAITSRLALSKNKPSIFNNFNTYFKNKLDIVSYMQEECEKFKKRIYKMIYKFLSDFILGNYTTVDPE